MVEIRISDSLAERLREAARRENLSLDEYAERLLYQQMPSEATPEGEEGDPPPGTMAALAQAALRANIPPGNEDDIAMRSRDIIREEMEKRLTRWMDENERTSGE